MSPRRLDTRPWWLLDPPHTSRAQSTHRPGLLDLTLQTLQHDQVRKTSMSSTDRHRVSKRWHHACQNCRRKKTRCPGERPVCSTCARLYQVCRYGDESNSPNLADNETRGNLEGRLAQLEEKMEQMLERVVPEQRNQEEPSHSSAPEPNNYNERVSATVNCTPPPAMTSEPLPSRDVISEIISLYFRFCHRQPLWLFERQELSAPDALPEELTFSLLALTIRFSTQERLANQAQELSQRYAEVARGHIMFRIAQGSVQLSTIQSLCLLALSNFVSQNCHLAWLNIDLANSLCMAADLNVETNRMSSFPSVEAKRRTFYSLHILNELYAPRSMMLNMLDDIENPRYMEPKCDTSEDLGRAPPLTPHELANINQVEHGGIWTYMAQQTSLWREVRGYVAQCANGSPKPPWSPDSGYAMIGAHLMEVETRFPTYHRYDAVRFLDRSVDELQRDRDYWSPWLYLQFGYHAIHSMLNHPFLYSSRPHQFVQMSVPNTFWKTSSELALLHSTWTARLVDMVWEKNYRVTDPYIGYFTAIAATILIYYCRAADVRTRTSAKNRLNKCMKFVDELGTIWPVCRWIHDRLDTLVQSAFKSIGGAIETDSNRRTVSINTSLMWDILDFARTKPSQKPGRGIFDKSFVQDPPMQGDKNNGQEGEDGHTVETQIFHRPNLAADVDTSDGGQELPPFSDVTVHSKKLKERQGPIDHPALGDEQQVLEQQQDQDVELSVARWSAAEVLDNAAVMDISYDPFFQFQDHDSEYRSFWEIGNL